MHYRWRHVLPSVLCSIAVIELCTMSVGHAESIQTNRSPKKCLDVTNGSVTNGTKIQVWDCVNENTNQQWSLTSSGQIQLAGTGKCIDVVDGATANGTKLQIWDCVSGNTSQIWDSSNGRLVWRNHNKCIDLTDGKSTNGNQPQIWDCVSNNTDQQWSLVSSASGSSTSVAAGAQFIQSVQVPGKCIDLTNGSTSNGTKLQSWDCASGNTNQSWLVADGAIKLGSKCIDVVDGSTQNGTQLQIWDCVAGNTSQQWQYAGGRLVWANHNKCIDLTDGSHSNGTSLQIWDCVNGNTSQQWTLSTTVAASNGSSSSGSSSSTWSGTTAASGYIESSKNPGKCVDLTDGGKTNGLKVQIWDCTKDNTNQQWTLDANGQIRIGSKCLDVVDGATKNGTQVQLWDCVSGNTSQRWSYQNNRITWNNKCLDITDNNKANGTKLQIWDCANDNTAQQWNVTASPTFSASSGSSSGSSNTTPSTSSPSIGSGSSSSVSAWVTTPDLQKALTSSTPTLGTLSGAAASVTINPSKTYQSIVGAGGSLTDSSTYVLNTLSASAKTDVLNHLFNTSSGIGVSFLRQPMAGTDFSSVGDYSYDDNPSGNWDEQLSNFSIAQDLKATVPILKESLGINPDIVVVALPWSAPAWMKTNASMDGRPAGNGEPSLKTEAYDVFARYFVKFIKAYADNGIPIHAVSPQNEPLNLDAAYPAMGLTAAEETTFIRENLGPALKSANLSTVVWGYDHNWDDIGYPQTIMADVTAASYTEGAAFHCYAGDISAMTTFHNNYPDKSIYISECSGGGWQSNALSDTIDLIINGTRNWARVISLWNLVLDSNSGPANKGCSNCRGFVTVDTSSGKVSYNIDYYAMGHMSKFVQSGAVRIDSSSSGSINAVAFKNPDGSFALIGHNTSQSDISLQVNGSTQNFNLTVPAGAAVTFTWK